MYPLSFVFFLGIYIFESFLSLGSGPTFQRVLKAFKLGSVSQGHSGSQGHGAHEEGEAL